MIKASLMMGWMVYVSLSYSCLFSISPPPAPLAQCYMKQIQKGFFNGNSLWAQSYSYVKFFRFSK